MILRAEAPDSGRAGYLPRWAVLLPNLEIEGPPLPPAPEVRQYTGDGLPAEPTSPEPPAVLSKES